MSAVTEYSDRLLASEHAIRVKGFEPLLRSELGDGTDARWDLIEQGGRPLLHLEVRDHFSGLRGEASADFLPRDLEAEPYLQRRLYDLKGAMVRVGAWRQQLERLYQEIRAWCAALAPEWLVEEEKLVVREQRAGEYHVSWLRISAAGRRAEVRPVGAWVVGAEGRVDVIGSDVRHGLILSRREGKWIWEWVNDRAAVRLQPLTGELFVGLVRDCMA